MNREFDALLTQNCAPVIMGAKVSNLLCCSLDKFPNIEQIVDEYRELFKSRGLEIEFLWKTRSRVLVLVYAVEKMNAILSDGEIIRFLEKYGYHFPATIRKTLDTFKGNVKENGEFPHEIGLFLGYPLLDVIGFIHHKGKNPKACGYWKVYGEVESSLALFDTFTRCKDIACQYLQNGYSFRQILQVI